MAENITVARPYAEAVFSIAIQSNTFLHFYTSCEILMYNIYKVKKGGYWNEGKIIISYTRAR